MFRLFAQLSCAFYLLAPSYVGAEPAKDLTQLLGGMNAATGQFEQSLVDVKGQQLQASQGTFSVKKPGKFLWLTESPFPQQLISNGQELWLYDADLEQASISAIDADSQQTPALLLSGDAKKLKDQFTILQAASADSNVAAFELTSKNTKAAFTRISASFTAGVLSRMSFVDKIGNTTVFVFDGVTLNPVLADGLFDFTPPKGTDVIRND
ncbi:outer membrane lipoprotein chaperone LolA [Simiduia curdlanivorans]|uniref:Outer-membrane lipoprotein carrier protein n=1 Tax=Simiduia curdlanivorans TaxID=1492769 RepID=A0ABV8V396_9GAMM|nr:outer membrane lipoprotein chaperone LolA [Simiduia curdlanivorans]MDN3639947.1 outer membrane lipoprotein chaperone LolA [Simiduia curdlanivorans]